MMNAPDLDDQSSAGRGGETDAVLTEAVRHVDVIHTSLAGMTAIVIMLLAAVALPVFGKQPVTQPLAFWVMTVASFIGIAGLYILNFRVHKHVTDQARLTEVLVNSLGQGFLFFSRDGICGSVYSQACLDLLECVPANKSISEVLHIPEEQREDFQDWIDVLFQPDHALGFDDVIRFFPQFFSHSQQRRVTLVYKPIYGPSGELSRIVLIATDQTEEYAARQAAKRQQNFAEMICRIFKDRNQFQSTMAHVRDFLSTSEREGLGLVDAPRILRQIHTLKATVKQFNLIDFGEVMHTAESDLRNADITTDEVFVCKLRETRQKIGDALARVTEEVSSLIGTEYEWRGNVREIGEDDIYGFAHEMKARHVDPQVVGIYLSRIAAVPIRDCFHSFERELRELAGILDKQVKPIKFVGSNPHVLTKPIQELLFSFTHICRNIVDHGIETPVTRMARGKDAAGQVTITCSLVNEGQVDAEQLNIVITDDGNGIDPSRVRAKLASVDPDGDWRFEDDQAVIQRIFLPNFTTAETVTTISGRGIGMEAVEAEVKKLGGTVHVMSQLYKGSSFDITVPNRLNDETT
ncbi:MAG: ATP-binding protein [Alphaproteobacteria bacterium]|nr:ATP-binding protein [Alphaproteobacteria bacterium]